MKSVFVVNVIVKRYCISIFLILILASLFVVPAQAQNGNQISLGLRTHDWFFMWKNGHSLAVAKGLDSSKRLRWAVTLATLNRYPKLGAEWNLIILRQGVDGLDNFSRAKTAVHEYQLRGIKPVFRLIEDPAVYSKLLTSPNRQYGYSKKYYEWIKRIAQIFKDDVHIYLIGNEIDSGLSHNLNQPMRSKYKGVSIKYDQYRKILDTAYKAIKGVDPVLKVADHGVSGFVLGLAVADDMIQKGHYNDAYNFWINFKYNRNSNLKTISRLVMILKRPGIQQRIAVARSSFLHPGKHDYLQLHYYGNWKALPTILRWIKEQTGKAYAGSILLATEVGYERPSKHGTSWDGKPTMVADLKKFSEEEQAVNLVKDFIILFGHGVDYAEYWYSRSTNPDTVVAPLYAFSKIAGKFKPNKAAIAYSVLAHSINRLNLDKKNNISFPGIKSFTFSGYHRVTVLWANESPVSIPVSFFHGLKKVINMYGSSLDTIIDKHIIVGRNPLYVFW